MVSTNDPAWVTEQVLRAVEQIPPGRVASYGLIAQVVGTGPRQVGAIMARAGAAVAWWWVTNAAGDLPIHLLSAALEQWAAEGITIKPNGQGCRYGDYCLGIADFDSIGWGHDLSSTDSN